MSQLTAIVTFSMICFAAGDQFFSTTYYFNLRQICTSKLSQYLVFISISFGFFHSFLFIMFMNIQPLVGCIIYNEIWLRYATIFFYPVLMGFLPIVIASMFSLLAFRNVRRIIRRQIPIERRRFDQQITAMVLVHVVSFVIFTIPYDSYRTYAINNRVDQTNLFAYAIVTLIEALIGSIVNLNFAVNVFFFFYLIYIG